MEEQLKLPVWYDCNLKINNQCRINEYNCHRGQSLTVLILLSIFVTVIIIERLVIIVGVLNLLNVLLKKVISQQLSPAEWKNSIIHISVFFRQCTDCTFNISDKDKQRKNHGHAVALFKGNP